MMLLVDEDPPTTPKRTEKTVSLLSGGRLSISLSVDLFELLSKEDRDFVFGLIDMLQAYEAKNPTKEENE